MSITNRLFSKPKAEEKQKTPIATPQPSGNISSRLFPSKSIVPAALGKEKQKPLTKAEITAMEKKMREQTSAYKAKDKSEIDKINAAKPDLNITSVIPDLIGNAPLKPKERVVQDYTPNKNYDKAKEKQRILEVDKKIKALEDEKKKLQYAKTGMFGTKKEKEKIKSITQEIKRLEMEQSPFAVSFRNASTLGIHDTLTKLIDKTKGETRETGIIESAVNRPGHKFGAISGNLMTQIPMYALGSPLIAATKLGKGLLSVGNFAKGATGELGALGAFSGKQSLELGIDVAIQTPQEIVSALNEGKSFGEFSKSLGKNLAWSAVFNGAIGLGAEGFKALGKAVKSPQALSELESLGVTRQSVEDATNALKNGDAEPMRELARITGMERQPSLDIGRIGATTKAQEPSITTRLTQEPIQPTLQPTATKVAQQPTTQQPTPIQARDTLKMSDRSIDELGNRTVKAYQHENPEVKPYYKEQATELLNDLKDTQKGRKTFVEDDLGYKFGGEKRITSDLIADIKDSTGKSYEDIKVAIEKIIKDGGLENNALSKRIEMIIDDSLTNGYRSFDGQRIPPNAEYINLKNSIEGVPLKQQNEFDKWAEELTGKSNFTPQELEGLKRVYDNQKPPQSITARLTQEPTIDIRTQGTLATGQPMRSVASDMTTPPSISATAPKIETKLPDGTPANYPREALESGQEYRRTISNSLERADIDEEVKQAFRDNPEVYQKITNEETWAKAWNNVNNNRQQVLDNFNAKGSLENADDTAEAISLVRQFANEGDIKSAVKVARGLSEKATRSGQAIQAIVMLQRTTPEGQLYRATSTVKKVEDAIKKENPVKYKKFKEELDKFPEKADELRKKYNIPTVTDAEADEIIKRMLSAQQLTGRAKDVEIAKVEQMISNKIPTTIRDKILAIRNISLLLNPKTLVRNPLGNVIFSGMENMAHVPSGITDAMVSKILKTPRQTKILPDLKTQAIGFGKGLKETVEDARLNIDTSPTRGGIELPRNRKVFETAWLNKANNWLSNALQFGDRPFYQAAYDARLKELMDLNPNVSKQELESLANGFGLEKVFQNASDTSKAVGDVKKGLNKLINVGGEKGVGLGDIAMPYTQTPANILAKGLEYTPLNIINIAKKAGTLGRTRSMDAQKQFTDSVGRMFTGTGLIALGYKLAENGMVDITGKAPKSEKERKLWEAQGKRNYSIKIGDKWYSVDWAQPAAMPLMLGVDFKNSMMKEDDLLKGIESGFTSAGDTIFKQGMLQGITRMFGGSSPATGIAETVIGTPTQFIPTLSSQLSQFKDPYKRETEYGGLEGVKQQLIKKTPLRQTLPIKKDMLGREMMESTGEMSAQKAIETFLSPSIVSKDTSTPVLNEVDRVFRASKDTDVIPYKMPSMADTPEKQEQFKQYFGNLVNSELEKLIKMPEYKALPDTSSVKGATTKASVMAMVINNAETTAKNVLFPQK